MATSEASANTSPRLFPDPVAMPATASPKRDRAVGNVRRQTRCHRRGTGRPEGRPDRGKALRQFPSVPLLPTFADAESLRAVRFASLAHFRMDQPHSLCEKAQQQQSGERLGTPKTFTREIRPHRVEPSVLPCRRQFALSKFRGHPRRTFCHERSRHQHGECMAELHYPDARRLISPRRCPATCCVIRTGGSRTQAPPRPGPGSPHRMRCSPGSPRPCPAATALPRGIAER